MITWLKKLGEMWLLYLSKNFPMFLNFLQPNPIDASIKVTERCNSKCITCDVWKKKPERELTKKEIENIFWLLREIGIKMVGFTGGECLLRDDLGELIRKAKEITKAKVYINTNGFLLEEKAETILENGVDFIFISLDGIGKLDEKIRNMPGHYERVIRGIRKVKRIIQERNLKVGINVGTTLLSYNLCQIPELINLCKNLGVTWSYNLLDNTLYFFKEIETSNLLPKEEELVDWAIDYLYKTYKKEPETLSFNPLSLEFARSYLKNKRPFFHCAMGYFRIYINSKLDVYSGCWALPPIGNLEKENLKSILKAKRYKERIKQMFKLNCPRCSCGYMISLMIENLPLSFIYLFKDFQKYKRYLKFII